MIVIDSERSATPNGRTVMPFLTPPLTFWTEPRPATAPRLTADQIEAIIVRAEKQMRDDRTRQLVARLNALAPDPRFSVPADWREQAVAAEPSHNRAGEA